MAKKPTLKGELRKYEESAEDRRKDMAGAKKLLKKDEAKAKAKKGRK
jgi:hypothetical protein